MIALQNNNNDNSNNNNNIILKPYPFEKIVMTVCTNWDNNAFVSICKHFDEWEIRNKLKLIFRVQLHADGGIL